MYEWYTWFSCEISVLRGVGVVCDMCMCLAGGGVGGEGGEWMRELGLGFTNPVGTGGVLDVCLCFGCGGVGGVGGEGQGAWTRVWRGDVISVGDVSLDSLCRWQVHVSVYCAWRTPAHLRCTQCTILLHLMDICFLTWICCCRPTPPACSCGGVRQPSFSREALPGVSST